MPATLNRQQRRQLEQQRARHRAQRRVERPVRTPMIVGSDLVLRPLESIIDRLEIDGTVDVDQKGTPVFNAADGQWYDAAGAIEGVMWHFEMIATRHGLTLPLDGLNELVIAFRYVVPVRESTVAKLRNALPVLRRVMATASPDDQIDILQQTRIKAELEAQA